MGGIFSELLCIVCFWSARTLYWGLGNRVTRAGGGDSYAEHELLGKSARHRCLSALWSNMCSAPYPGDRGAVKLALNPEASNTECVAAHLGGGLVPCLYLLYCRVSLKFLHPPLA